MPHRAPAHRRSEVRRTRHRLTPEAVIVRPGEEAFRLQTSPPRQGTLSARLAVCPRAPPAACAAHPSSLDASGISAYRSPKGAVAVGEPGKELVSVVASSPFPTTLVRLPGGEILAASDEAGRLMGVAPSSLVGRNVHDFAMESPTEPFRLLATGRLSGYEADRSFRRDDGEVRPVHLWIRAGHRSSPVEFAIALLWPAGHGSWAYLPGPSPEEPPPVVGMVNSRLEVVMVSEDVHVLGVPATELVGTSIFRIVDESSAADLLQALAEGVRTNRALSVTVTVHYEGHPIFADLMLRPMVPSPSFTFSFLCDKSAKPLPDTDVRSLNRLGHGLHALALAEAFRLLDEAQVAGTRSLSAREIDIVARLLAGDRVPAIAKAMFLSASTVRNHLSRAFRKLGVTSQQELIELFRESAQRLHTEDKLPTSA